MDPAEKAVEAKKRQESSTKHKGLEQTWQEPQASCGGREIRCLWLCGSMGANMGQEETGAANLASRFFLSSVFSECSCGQWDFGTQCLSNKVLGFGGRS